MSRKILFVLTNHDRLGNPGDETAEATGFHLYEAAKPWATLVDAGFHVDIVTPKGGVAPIDPSSRESGEPESARFLNDAGVASAIESSRSLSDIDLSDYDAIYFPGGHGTMWDLPHDDAVRNAVAVMLDAGKVVAAVCHGPAAFVNAKLADGSWAVDGRDVACFTDDEERAVEKDTLMPFLLGTRLQERGANLIPAANFDASVAVDGTLVTGQNPASAPGVGEAIRDLVAKIADEAA
jgi:putative intracellular protease/amidase